MNKRESISRLSSGGFHQTWLIFVELISSGLVVTIGLKYSFVLAFFVVIVPTYILLRKIAEDPVRAIATAHTVLNKLASLPYSVAIRLRNPRTHTKPAVSLAQ